MSMMHVYEGEVRTAHNWTNGLQISSKELDSLIAAKVLRPQGEDLRLSFVGLLAYPSHVIHCKPKFARNIAFNLSQTIAVLKRYFSRSNTRKPFLDSMRDPEFSDRYPLREFDLVNELDNWFKAHGTYRREHQRLGSVGRIHWPRTIASQQPLHVQGSTIYPKLVAERREGVLNEVSSIQLGITKALLEKYDLPVSGSLRHAELSAGAVNCNLPLDEM